MKKTRKSLQAIAGSKQISFLPEPDFNPILPSKNTNAYIALSLMLRGKKITHRSFDSITSSWRLAVYIDKLKNKLGWPVQSEDVRYLGLKQRKKRIISRYFLTPEVIKRFKSKEKVL